MSPDTNPDGLLLSAYRPRRALRTPDDPAVDMPAWPVINSHEHLGPVFGGDWPRRPVAELLSTMDAVGILALVDLDGGQGDACHATSSDTGAASARLAVFAGLDYEMWREEPAFGEVEASRLRDSMARGARGLKVLEAPGSHGPRSGRAGW